MNTDDFVAVFHHNLTTRSRTAKGVGDTSSTPGKKDLLLSGASLVAQVKSNSGPLIQAVLHAPMPPAHHRAVEDLVDEWNDLATAGLQSSYRPDQGKQLLEAVERYRVDGGRPWDFRTNPRWRVSTPKYTDVAPESIGPELDQLYQMLSLGRAWAENPERILATADCELDGRIHPYSDGCGRTATALVMWLVRIHAMPLPVFGNRDEHYANINNPEAHAEYFRRCFSRPLP